MKFEVGGLICHLETKDQDWRKFLQKKYEPFLVDTNIKEDFRLLIFPQKKRKRFSLFFPSGFRKAKIFTPLSLRRFRTFDFFLKTALTNFFLEKKGFFLHASSLVKNGQGLIFAGKRRVGKSTVIKLASIYEPLNDDFAIIRKIKGKFFVFSSPFYETNPIIKINSNVPVHRLYFLVQSNNNSVETIKRENCVPKIASLILSSLSLSRLSKKQEKLILEKIWTNANDFARAIPCFMLYFKKDHSFLRLL